MEFGPRANREQFQKIVEIMEKFGDLSRQAEPGVLGRLKNANYWLMLADTLNPITGGVSRPPDRWKKLWADWKLSTIKKAKQIKSQTESTEAGTSASVITLTEFEERILAIMSKKVEDTPATVVKDETEKLPPLTMASLQNDKVKFYPQKECGTPKSSPSRDPSDNQWKSRQPGPRGKRGASRWSIHAQDDTDSLQKPVPGSSSSPKQPKLDPSKATLSERQISLVALENRRLRLDELREKNESRRIKIEQERNLVLNRFADIAEALLSRYTSGDTANP